MKTFCGLACSFVLVISVQRNLVADDANASYDDLIPQYLLGLLHAPEVHKELKLSAKQIEDLEALHREIDAKWFPARILPAEQHRPLVRELESRMWEWFEKSTAESQRQRLQQLEYRAQGSRTLLRRDIAKKVDLQPTQRQKLATLARATDDAHGALARTLFGDPQLKALELKADKAAKAEREGVNKILRPAQLHAFNSLLGDHFDPTKLKRIYALAPEFAPVERWINSSPLRMRDLRGKVVLVHFYAFQCHNCHANFPIYQRWHQELTSKGVVVVGIQTPETKRERDADAVAAAARERDLKFPIMVDLDSENWKAWGNSMWPCVYVVDKHGYVRLWWAGELNWKGATADRTIEVAVQDLLKEE